MGTQNIFCGTGIRALRAHKLRPSDDDERDAAAAAQEAPRGTASGIRALRARKGRDAGSDSGADGDRASDASGERSRVSTSDAAGAASAADSAPSWSVGIAEGEQWEQELLMQLKAVKIEEAWEGHDSFAEMEMGLDVTDAEPDAGAGVHAVHAVRAEPPTPPRAPTSFAPLKPSTTNAPVAFAAPKSAAPLRPGLGPLGSEKPRARPGARPGMRPGAMSTASSGSINVLTLDDSTSAPSAPMVTTS